MSVFTALRTAVWLQSVFLGMSVFMSLHTPLHTCAYTNGFQKCTACLQLYGCNVLNLGNSRIISVHAHTARQIVRDSHFRGDVQIIDFTPITSMYGAVHCSSQARPICFFSPTNDFTPITSMYGAVHCSSQARPIFFFFFFSFNK